MSHKTKAISTNDTICEKYLSKMLRQENIFAKRSQAPASKPFQEKFSHLAKQTIPVQPPRPKPKPKLRQQSPMQRGTQLGITFPKELENITPVIVKEQPRSQRPRRRSASGCRSISIDRDSWGQILQNKKSKSKEKVSTFSNFDPLRTLHFLSKELSSKLKTVTPDDNELLQMAKDIQQALHRIPPEISSLLHNPQSDSNYMLSVSTKICQTPPTLYQEDTEKFQKIMEENTYRLESSCKQLELVCTNLQSEKEMTEKELEEAKENVEFLCQRVKDLEGEMEEITNTKLRQLEDEKQHLQQELAKALSDVTNNPTMNHLRKLVEELKKQKGSSDETCARLEYDMTLLKMEKEKFVTMLAVRDREIKEIQEEMAKIQDQVNQQLRRLNGEVMLRVDSIKAISDSFNGQENLFLEFGDSTMSSITTNESDRETLNVIKESPCGDAQIAGMPKNSDEELRHKLKADDVEIDLPSSNIDRDIMFEDLLTGLTPSVKALLVAHDIN